MVNELRYPLTLGRPLTLYMYSSKTIYRYNIYIIISPRATLEIFQLPEAM